MPFFLQIKSKIIKSYHAFMQWVFSNYEKIKVLIVRIFQTLQTFLFGQYHRIKQRIRKWKLFLKKVKISSDKHKIKISRRDEEFITDSKAALLNEISPTSDKIIISVVVLIIAAVIWAHFGVIEQTITAHGVIIPSSHVKIIQSLDGGILEELYVKEGQVVEKGQNLLELDDTRYKAEYQQLYEQYLILLATIARLTAETQDKNEIIFPEELKKHQSTIETENKLFHTRRQALQNEVQVLQESYDYAMKEINMYKPLIAKGVSSQLELLRAERSANELQSRMLEKIGAFREGAWTDLNKRQGELAVTRERLLGLKDKMDRTTLTSPVHGVIKKINVVTIGAVIQPAINIMEIVPLQDVLMQAKINSSDIGFVYIGAPASVKIDAYDYSIYGSIPGKVEYISADIISTDNAENHSASNKTAHFQSFYLVNIRTAQDYILHHDKKLPIIPGMTAVAQITVGHRTLLQYILKPIIKAKSEALRER